MKTYLRHRSLNVIDVKELIALEYLDFEGKYKNYEENHDFCELCFVERGEITLSLAGGKIELGKGDIILIEPEARHSYFSKNGNESRAFVICFECPSHTLKPLSAIRFSSDESQLYCMKRIIDESAGTFRMNERDQLELIPTASFGGQQAIILQLEYLLLGLLRKLSENNSGIVFLNGEKFYPDLVEIIKGYLKSNLRQKIALNDICERFNYSRSFICKIFKEQTGETLISYFNSLKIDEAKRLLLETEMSVMNISELLGFSEAKYFGIVFKNAVGISPAAYRAKIKSKESL